MADLGSHSNVITYKDLLKISWPLFILPNENWYKLDGVLFLDNLVVDETNMPGKTLGLRRIQCNRTDLLPLKKAIFDIPALLNNRSKFFIDSKGKPFVYQKTVTSKLKCYRIKSIEQKDSASLLWVHEINYPFTLARPPLNNPEWVRILHLNKEPWVVYDYVRSFTEPTYRRV